MADDGEGVTEGIEGLSARFVETERPARGPGRQEGARFLREIISVSGGACAGRPIAPLSTCSGTLQFPPATAPSAAPPATAPPALSPLHASPATVRDTLLPGRP